MKKQLVLSLFAIHLFLNSAISLQGQTKTNPINLSAIAKEQLAGKQILYIERDQYAADHHNTATLFQCGEINEDSFAPGSAMRLYDVDSGTIRTLLECPDGVVRDSKD